MLDLATPQELERRKSLRLRLRPDLDVEAQKYEGRTFFVLKDPISLRYYRLKDNEHYLLQFMDGKRTLEEAQKAYEKHYRPERLKLEDLEAFAQQLITAGLAQNDSPRAGKQLYDRRKKRRRTEWMQTLTNILYIKLPLIDPDRLLKYMLKYVGFVFTLWFFLLSVGAMLAAAMLVATHFDTFRAKLPNYHEFFQFKTVVYLWGALAVVKVIHEFGHGLSCKRFGGEVHEMGALFLCFSPALYCNVSDAWTLPSKWHRIIISGAGIYVELLIATIATFVWWNTPSQPFIHNMSLSLMVVCSVSTIVFNANPLMRYDGYYVLADWLEIPNLREKSNRYLTNLILEQCLGVEVQPEPYMEFWRKVLFVLYAVVSYVYRWVITFTILWFMYNWLRPYKLEVLSTMLALASLASMLIWPIYRLIKNIYRRGRLPDMKRWRVVTTCTIVAVLLVFVFFVKVPVSRVRAVGVVEAPAEVYARMEVAYAGRLKALYVISGQTVKKDDILAEFSNIEVQTSLIKAERDEQNAEKKYKEDEDLIRQSTEKNKTRAQEDLREVEKRLIAAQTDKKKWQAAREALVLRARVSGIVSGAPPLEEIGKEFEKGYQFCTIVGEGRRIKLPLETVEYNQLRANLLRISPAAVEAWHQLELPVVCNYSDTMLLKDALADLGKQAGGAKIVLDANSPMLQQLGHERLKRSYALGNTRLAEALDAILPYYGLGYVVNVEGQIDVRAGKDRGVLNGQRTLTHLPITIRIHGRDSATWQGVILRLPEKEADNIPKQLSSRFGGPVAVKGGIRTNNFVPQTQHYLVDIAVIDPDTAVVPGVLAQVKIYCEPETCWTWLKRTIYNLFDVPLI